MTLDRRKWKPGAFATQFGLLVGVFALVIACLVTLSILSAGVTSSLRAYVGGEGLWSKAQKTAVISLRRYAHSRDDDDLAAYRASIAITLADRQAREELEKPHPDLPRAWAGFIGGRNHPDDVKGMARLFRTFRHVGFVDRAIGIWAAADGEVDHLNALADELHARVHSQRTSDADLGPLLREIDETDRRLTRKEEDFSYTLGAGARWLDRVVGVVLTVWAALLLALALVVSRRLLASIRESNERYRRLLETANDPIFVTDLESGEIVEANSKAAELLGVPAASIVGRAHTSLHPDRQQARVRTLVWSPGTRAFEEEEDMVVTTASGAEIPVEIGVSITELDRRRVAQCIYRDLRARRSVEHALREREDQMRQSQKMEAIGRLAGGVAHDFNNLLTAILGHSSLMEDQLEESHPLRRAADEIRKAAETAARLTYQLLAYSRRQVLDPRVLDLDAVVSDIEEMLRRLLGEDVELVRIASPGPVLVRVDRNHIEQALINLAVNARDAMPEGGTLTIETGAVQFPGLAPAPAGLAPGRYVVLTVRDTGEGMDAETCARIFEPFFSTKERGRGTGLGLSMVDGIVRQSGGHIEVRSEPGRGSSFHLYFPRIESHVLESIPTPPVEIRPAGGGVLLLAEDEAAVREIARYALETAGFRVLVAGDGIEALEVAAAEPGPIDALVTDVIMPRMNGRRLAAQLAELRPQIRVLYISGYSDDGVFPDGLLEPGSAFLGKPFSPQQLVRRVQATLGAYDGSRATG